MLSYLLLLLLLREFRVAVTSASRQLIESLTRIGLVTTWHAELKRPYGRAVDNEVDGKVNRWVEVDRPFFPLLSVYLTLSLRSLIVLRPLQLQFHSVISDPCRVQPQRHFSFFILNSLIRNVFRTTF